VAHVDYECILWDIFVPEVVSAQQEHYLGVLVDRPCRDSKVKGTNLAGVSVQYVYAVPTFFLVDQVCLGGQLVYVILDGFTVSSGECFRAHYDHRECGFLDSL